MKIFKVKSHVNMGYFFKPTKTRFYETASKAEAIEKATLDNDWDEKIASISVAEPNEAEYYRRTN